MCLKQTTTLCNAVVNFPDKRLHFAYHFCLIMKNKSTFRKTMGKSWGRGEENTAWRRTTKTGKGLLTMSLFHVHNNFFRRRAFSCPPWLLLKWEKDRILRHTEVAPHNSPRNRHRFPYEHTDVSPIADVQMVRACECTCMLTHTSCTHTRSLKQHRPVTAVFLPVHFLSLVFMRVLIYGA